MIRALFWIWLCAVVYAHFTVYVQAEEVTATGTYAQYLNVEPGDLKGQSSDKAWELRKPDRYKMLPFKWFNRNKFPMMNESSLITIFSYI